jgi:hypothetical protein
MKNFNVRPFFSLFFIARANQKIRILALGRASTRDVEVAIKRDKRAAMFFQVVCITPR